ncbi:hypothetical protein PCC7424_5397 (plasmid) [Gloeothece citriformis PCC 7424]|uniref:Uncharacterized protein n=1 Tax=Gloeothece citriformis (strain PCC 7424) TaxID=65393 RepID=B7KMF3_GLOC7|nr:hypothetical protein [Gloeothece citriformis]ACK73975.1 hypothetical protein PCC7424_5397 [Gloeothece citriformis PCC 7424]
MDLYLQDINLYISESDVVKTIINQRLQELKSQEPRFKLVFPRAILAFIWLFMILASFAMLGISIISFSLNLIVISKVYYNFGIFLVSVLLIPMIASWRKYWRTKINHNNQLHLSRTKPINITEIKSYFSAKKNNFIRTYQEYVKNIRKKIDHIEKSQHLNSTTVDKMQSLQERISQAVDRLEILKNDYFSRLDCIELELKNKLVDYQSEMEIEVLLESKFLVEKLEEEVQAINYYLQAVDEINGK